MGITISFAGNPQNKAHHNHSVHPHKAAEGLEEGGQMGQKALAVDKQVAGQPDDEAGRRMTTQTARARTNRVLSKIERTTTLPNCGRLYGGLQREGGRHAFQDCFGQKQGRQRRGENAEENKTGEDSGCD